MNAALCQQETHSKGEFCRQLIDALASLKHRLVSKYESMLPGSGDLIRRAVNEAEQAAWETAFPQLLLPDLAEARLSTLAPAYARAR
jgi:hypothetical protein